MPNLLFLCPHKKTIFADVASWREGGGRTMPRENDNDATTNDDFNKSDGNTHQHDKSQVPIC